ncbi:hypothetical protein R1sor_025050 [Riccia sorocarpa]|uniref:MULE transposase domain-containing protein n=1 Tax=Riccia sorocarpa TaxID=122646 RepID=A0ABD3G905_9MARC
MRDICQDMIAGCQMEFFAQIHALCERIQDADPGGLIDWDTFENSYTFMRAFICPSATRGILRYCQKVVALDACFTKNKKYPTQLFLASVIDGNSQVVPLAYAVAPVENYENWRWFLYNLQISIQGLRSEVVMIVSDRQKDLERAVTEVLPCNPHMHCGHHLKMNVQKLFGNLLHAKSEDRFNSVMEEAGARLDQGSQFTRYIQRIDPAMYALYAMPLPRGEDYMVYVDRIYLQNSLGASGPLPPPRLAARGTRTGGPSGPGGSRGRFGALGAIAHAVDDRSNT